MTKVQTFMPDCWKRSAACLWPIVVNIWRMNRITTQVRRMYFLFSALLLGKNWSNVDLNMAWISIINPRFAHDALDELLDVAAMLLYENPKNFYKL